jgi:hypothetical protein
VPQVFRREEEVSKMATATTTGSIRHKLSGSVMVDRNWGGTIGASHARGAQRVGNFYRLPKSEYVRLMAASARSHEFAHHSLNPANDPCLDWTESDDLAVAELLERATGEKSPCLD